MKKILSKINQHQQVNTSQLVPVQTSVVAIIDHDQPDDNDEFVENRNINEIVRKTMDNIMHLFIKNYVFGLFPALNSRLEMSFSKDQSFCFGAV